MRNCDLVKSREKDKVTLEELEKQRAEALELVEKEREIVEQDRAVYDSYSDKLSKRHTSHNDYTDVTLTQRNSRVIYMMPCTLSMWSSQQ